MRQPCLGRRTVCLAALATGALLPLTATALDLDENTYRTPELGIVWEVPEGWALQRQTGYPPLLALLLSRQGPASISLAVGPEGSGDRMDAFVASNREGLTAVGLLPMPPRRSSVAGKPVWLLESRTQDRKTATRQLYLQHGRRAIIVTLTAPAAELKSYLWDLTQAVDSLQLSPPPSAQPVRRGGPAAETSSRAQPSTRPSSPPTSLPATKPLDTPELDTPELETPELETPRRETD